MEIFLYLAKVSGLQLLFIGIYFIFLKNLTFFTGNRVFLSSGLVISYLLPLFYLKKTVWTSQVFQRNSPVFTMPISETQSTFWNTEKMLLLFYFVIFFILTIRFLIQIVKLFYPILKRKFILLEGLKIIDHPHYANPFSFMGFVYLHKASLNDVALSHILKHEAVHLRQCHSADLIIAQLSTLVLWFNPLSYLYQKFISQNLEYIADDEAVGEASDKKNYQKTMLMLSTSLSVSFTNPFFQSSIKKRISMMHQAPSPRPHQIKYAFVLPLLVLFIWLFQVKVIAQEKKVLDEAYDVNITEISTIIYASSPDDEIGNDIRFIEKTTGEKISWKSHRNYQGFIARLTIGFNHADGTEGGLKIDAKTDSIMPIELSAKKNELGSFELRALPYLKELSSPKWVSNDTIGYVIEEVKKNDTLVNVLINEEPATFPVKMRMANIDTLVKNDHTYTLKIRGDAQSQLQDTSKINPLIIIDGKPNSEKMAPDELDKILNPEAIESITVLKGEQAIAKYGNSARDGAIEIITKKIPKEVVEQLNKNKALLYTNQLSDKAFYMLNGGRSTKEDVMQLDPGKINRINVLKGKAAIEKYGSLGRNGVIEVWTKPF